MGPVYRAGVAISAARGLYHWTEGRFSWRCGDHGEWRSLADHLGTFSRSLRRTHWLQAGQTDTLGILQRATDHGAVDHSVYALFACRRPCRPGICRHIDILCGAFSLGGMGILPNPLTHRVK